jgi:hypothetical protein
MPYFSVGRPLVSLASDPLYMKASHACSARENNVNEAYPNSGLIMRTRKSAHNNTCRACREWLALNQCKHAAHNVVNTAALRDTGIRLSSGTDQMRVRYEIELAGICLVALKVIHRPRNTS